jgi:hypothetical protein
MNNEIKLQTFKGKNVATGEEVEWDLDEVLVNGQRVAFVPHAANSGIRFLRILSAPTKKEIQDAVRTQRKAQDKADISDVTTEPPAPEKLPKVKS